jgi:hypothetical protein
VSLTTLLELAELKPNADNLVNLDCDGDEYCFYNEHDAFKPLCLTLDANYANPLVSSRKLGHFAYI